MGYAEAENPVDLFFGMKMANNSALGFRLTFADKIQETKQKENKALETSQTAQKIAFNVGYSIMGSSRIDMSLDIGISQKYAADAGNDPSNKRSYNENLTLKPNFRNIVKTSTGSYGYSFSGIFSNPKAKATATDENKSIKLKEMGLTGAYAQHFELPNNLGRLSAQARYTYLNSKAPNFVNGADTFLTSKESIIATSNVIDGTLAAEINATSYLGLIVSVNPVLWGRLVVKDNINPDEPKTTTTISANDQSFYSFGLYSEVTPAFRVDASYSSAIFYNGPHFVTGTATPAFISQISLSYIL